MSEIKTNLLKLKFLSETILVMMFWNCGFSTELHASTVLALQGQTPGQSQVLIVTQPKGNILSYYADFV